MYVVSMFQDTVDRLAVFDDQGFIVSRLKDGSPEHRGDALLWTGLALGTLPCDNQTALSLARGLRTMFRDLDGGVYRHPALPDKASMDGAIGLYWGLAKRSRRCSEEGYWADFAATHLKFLETHEVFRLNPSDPSSLTPFFDYLPRLLVAETAQENPPPRAMLLGMQQLTVAWTLATKAQRASCYRIHLALLSLETVETLGVSLDAAWRDAFCAAATADLGLPTVDNFCGREGLVSWVDDFEEDKWEYRHQRCSAWETPDGKPGLKTPGVDLLVAIRAAYNL
jgi:hypothetical protein